MQSQLHPRRCSRAIEVGESFGAHPPRASRPAWHRESAMTPAAMPANVAPQKPSKRPPPLPTKAAAAPPSKGAAVEEIFFLEGIDGRAESLPSADPSTPALDGTHA